MAIAMWGVPSFTYANNCSRGLSCAVLMNMRVRTVGHTCSIGLTTGMVYCGAVGSFNRQDYVGIGDTVNLAARLMSKGDGVYYVRSLLFVLAFHSSFLLFVLAFHSSAVLAKISLFLFLRLCVLSEIFSLSHAHTFSYIFND